jgi:hypothetical protein
MTQVLHEDLHEFLTPLRLGEVLGYMKPFFASQVRPSLVFLILLCYIW